MKGEIMKIKDLFNKIETANFVADHAQGLTRKYCIFCTIEYEYRRVGGSDKIRASLRNEATQKLKIYFETWKEFKTTLKENYLNDFNKFVFDLDLRISDSDGSVFCFEGKNPKGEIFNIYYQVWAI